MISPFRRLLMALGFAKAPKPEFSPEGNVDRWIGRDQAIVSSVRPQGNAAVPAGRASNPASRPYVINNLEQLGDDGRFLKVDALAYGEGTYPMELQEDLASGKVWMHCGCPDFTYRFEVIDTQDGYSSIRNSNGAYPVKTNPNGVVSACKHLRSLLSDPQVMNAEREWKMKRKEA